MNNVIKCVIVEDFPELNDIYFNLLRHEKEVEIVGRATNGDELFTILNTNNVDVVLMDIELETPNSGIDYCKKISLLYPHIKVIMLTCHYEENMILSAFEAGAVNYILKENSLSEVIKAIKSTYEEDIPIQGYAANILRKKMQQLGKMKDALFDITAVISKLTTSELDILKFLIKGYKQKKIAEEKFIELVTVKAHVGNILRKFKSKSTKDVIKKITQSGLETFITEL